jgi:ribosomal-protein-alanine N-acetyltransferase
MTDSDLKINKATTDDINVIFALESQIGSFPYSRAVIRQHFDLGSILYIAWHGDKALGYGLGAINALDRTAHIIAIMTLPEFRQKGIAKKLCERIIQELRGLQPTEIRAVVSPENVASLSLFRSLGFEEAARLENYYGQGETRILLNSKSSN